MSGVNGDEQKGPVWCLTSKILYQTDTAALIPPVSPGGDVTAQILEVIRENTATDEEVQEAINDAFASEWTPPDDPNDPENPDNTATDEEVEDILDAVFGDEP